MIKRRILQLVAIALYCVLIVGCKPNETKQAEETPLSQADSVKTNLTIVDSTQQLNTNTDSSNTESTDRTISPNHSSKGAEAVAEDKNEQDADSAKNSKLNESEKPDSTSQSDTTATVGVNADTVAIDTTLVDSLWNRLLVDMKILNDTTLNQADSESVNRDSLLEAAKKQKLDSLLIGMVHPTDTSGAKPSEASGWPWWLTVLTGVAGLLLGGLLTWLISKFTRKKGSSSGDKKEEKPKLKKEEFDSVDVKNKKLVEFYKRMIIK